MHNDPSYILKQLNLLLVDDNHEIHAELYALFSPMFKCVSLAHNSDAALEYYERNEIDIIISDIKMPGIDGLTLIETIRQSDWQIPIIVLTAHNDHDYLMRAANLQVDGYITKPLNFNKLHAALSRAVSRLEYRVKPLAITDAIYYHPLHKSLQVDSQEISLGSKECQLLELFLQNSHRVVTKNEIHSAVWPDEIVSESALKNLLAELRKKLKYNIIKNRHGRGWILATDT